MTAALTFDPAEHVYRHGARRLASVTEILLAVGLSKDLSFLHLSDTYRLKGSAVHTACKLVDEGRLEREGTHPEILPYADAYANFKRDTGFVARIWELPMADTGLGIAGTLDVIGEAKDEIWLPDFKTGVCPPTVGAQLAAYEYLVLNGAIIDTPETEAMPDEALVFLEWVRACVKAGTKKIKRKSLNLDGKKFTLRSHDEPRWPTIWRAAVSVYNARKEYNLL